MDEALRTRRGPDPRAEASGRTRAHVVVVDDNPHVLDLCACYLQEGGPVGPDGLETTVHYVTSGEEAIEVAERAAATGECLAYAILDFVLPGGLDGIDTILELWRRDPRIHCTLVTGAEEQLEAGIGGRLPADLLDRWDYLPKPFKRFEFMLRVRRALSSWHVRLKEQMRSGENEALLARLERMNRDLEQNVRERTLDLARRSEDQERKNVELEQALRRLEQVQGQLLQQEKMVSIGQLAAGVAHELNNPIGYVSSNMHTLERYVENVRRIIETYETHLFGECGPQDDELQRVKKELKVDYILEDLPSLVKESLEGSERVKKIVSDLKGFARPDEKEPKETDLNAGLESTLNIVRNEIKYHCEIELDLGDIPPVRCIPGQINQVFMNLIVNAGQAIDGKGAISISTEAEKGFVAVRIRDTGCGIPPENLERLFDPFFTTKGSGKGTGLGLSISHDIVRKHGGEITVESELGKGSCFTVRLPVDGRETNTE